MKLKNTIIYLIGFAGTGKLTIAKELAAISGAKIVDNHLINNPVFSIIKLDGSPIPEMVWQKIWEIRSTVIEVAETISPPDYSFIFTNELLEAEPDCAKLFAQVEALARARNAYLLPVRLLCDEPELARRMQSAERAAQHKDTNPQNAYRQARGHQLLNPPHPNTITLDVTTLSPKEAAKTVLSNLPR